MTRLLILIMLSVTSISATSQASTKLNLKEICKVEVYQSNTPGTELQFKDDNTSGEAISALDAETGLIAKVAKMGNYEDRLLMAFEKGSDLSVSQVNFAPGKSAKLAKYQKLNEKSERNYFLTCVAPQ